MRLTERYLDAMRVRVLAVDVTLAEVAAKLARIGREDDIDPAFDAIESGSAVLPIDGGMASLAARLQVELRRTDRHASIADALSLACARLHRAVLISADPCYEGQPDVRAS